MFNRRSLIGAKNEFSTAGYTKFSIKVRKSSDKWGRYYGNWGMNNIIKSPYDDSDLIIRDWYCVYYGNSKYEAEFYDYSYIVLGNVTKPIVVDVLIPSEKIKYTCDRAYAGRIHHVYPTDGFHFELTPDRTYDVYFRARRK